MKVSTLFEYETKKIDAFLRSIKNESTPDPNTKNSFWYKKVFFIIRPQRYSQSVHLEEIKSPEMGAGRGTAALMWFLNLADKHGIAVTLYPVQLYKDDGPTETKLRSWYAKHGFEGSPGSAIMRREPRKQVKEAVEEVKVGETYHVEKELTVSVMAPPCMYDYKAGAKMKVVAIKKNTVYVFIPSGNYSAYCDLDYFKKNVVTKREYDRQWMSGLKENIVDDLAKRNRYVIRPITVDVKPHFAWGKEHPSRKVDLVVGDVVVELSTGEMTLTNKGGGNFDVTPDMAGAFVTKKKWDRFWLNSLKNGDNHGND